jgi:ATP:ADP antiporter, AAA family
MRASTTDIATTKSNFLDRLALVKHEEWPAVFGAFTYFFCLLCGYYVLRPVRDEMGIQAGLKNLPWLFTATLVTMLVLVPVFGWLSSKFARQRLLPIVYLFFGANLLVFYILFSRGVAVADTAKAFFVWVSVFNLFVVSVFWSFMADLFSTEQAKRTYELIAAGGSVGAIIGLALSTVLAKPLGVANLLLLSAGFLLAAVVSILLLGSWARGRPEEKRTGAEAGSIGGGIWDGVKLVVTSRYLLGICGFVLIYSVLSTFLYFQQQHIVSASSMNSGERTALFAKFDLATNGLTLVMQIFVFSRLLKWLALAAGLVLIPLLSVVGYLALAYDPVLIVLAIFGTVRRAGEFAIAKPARETLFNALSREEKYKAKNFMDTAVYRTGDSASAWLFERLKGLGLSSIALIAAAGALVWALLGRWLVRTQAQIASTHS